MSMEILSKVWKNSRKSGEELLVLLAMANEADPETGVCVLNRERIAERARISVDDLAVTLRSLEEAGEIVHLPNCGPGIEGDCYQIVV